MISEHAQRVIRLLPAPCLVVASTGEVVAANNAGAALFALRRSELTSRRLQDLVADPADSVLSWLRTCSGSVAMLPGRLTTRNGGGTPISFRCGAAVLEPAADGRPALLLLRFEPAQGGASRFAMLNRQLDEMAREVRRRQQVQAERAALLRWTRDQHARQRFLADVTRELAALLDPDEVHAAVERLAVPFLGEACTVELHGPPPHLEELIDGRAVRPIADDRPRREPVATTTRASAELPLFLGGRRAGVLRVERGAERPFTSDDLATAQEYAARAGAALENAFLYRALRDAHARLQAQAEELTQTTEELEATNEALMEQMTEAELAADEARAMAEDAERARREAEGANRAKSDFLAMMSHELRTPLNAIAGYAELLELGVRGPVNDEQRSYLRRIRSSERHLLQLITDVLDFAKAERGRLDIRIGDVSLDETLAAVRELVEPQLAAKGHRFTYAPQANGLRCRADRERLQQVLVNLIGNAVKFTPAGGQISLRTSAGESMVEVVVEDTGLGIPPDKLEAIFEPFVQLHERRADRAEGAGLGLAISRELARAMGGDIRVESEPGRGSRFTLSLPRTVGD